jgi:hypothetical protein
MRKIVVRVLIALILLVLGAGGILYANLAKQMEEANASFVRRDQKGATARYEQLLTTFDKYPRLKPVLRRQFEAAVLEYAQLLYQQGRYEDAVKMLESRATDARSLAASGPYHLWLGNALFRVAVLKEGDNLSSESMETVAEEYEEALRLQPSNWDAKHNYEFVRYLQEKKNAAANKDDKNLQLLLSAIRMTTEERTGVLPEKLD